MGLMEGLSGWLRQIIAVVLLASLIDLLLPNRTMQRYVRLVAGLFILMTLATPILQWMQGDFSSKLAEGLRIVEQKPQDADVRLAMIEEEGAKLRDKHTVQAAELVSARLESAIRSEVEQSEQRAVRRVDVVLGRGSNGELAVAKVVVELEPAAVDTQSSPTPSAVKEIEPIEAVDIHVEVEGWQNEHEAASVSGTVTEPGEKVDRDTRLRIEALIASRFGIAANDVEVQMPAATTDKPN